jgi:hypothetical protein
MTTTEYPNSYFCTYKAVFCMDGYRSGCKMCLNSVSSAKSEEPKNWTRDVWEARTTVEASIFSKFLGVFTSRESSLSIK